MNDDYTLERLKELRQQVEQLNALVKERFSQPLPIEPKYTVEEIKAAYLQSILCRSSSFATPDDGFNDFLIELTKNRIQAISHLPRQFEQSQQIPQI